MIRDSQVDIAKGIGIALIVALHSGFHHDWLLTFEIPLFFILSGFFVKHGVEQSSFKPFFYKKFNVLIAPYILFEAPKWIYNILFSIVHPELPLKDCFINTSIPTATWFLLCLFEVQLCSWLLKKYLKKLPYLYVVSFLIACTGYWLSSRVENYLYLTTSSVCLFFYIIGTPIRRFYEILKLRYSNYVLCIIGVALLIITFLIWKATTPYYFYRGAEFDGSFIVMIITAVTGTFGILLASSCLIKFSWLSWIGKNTLIIFGIHLYCIIILQRAFHIETPWIIMITAFSISLIAVKPIRLIFPRLSGSKPLLPFIQSDEKKENTP